MNESIDDKINKIVEGHNIAFTKHYEWIKQVLVFATGLFGVLIALHKTPSQNNLQKWSFFISVCLLSIGILSGVITLYGEISAINQRNLDMTDELESKLKGAKSGPKLTASARKHYYDYTEKIFFITLALTIVGLTLYAFTIA